MKHSATQPNRFRASLAWAVPIGHGNHDKNTAAFGHKSFRDREMRERERERGQRERQLTMKGGAQKK